MRLASSPTLAPRFRSRTGALVRPVAAALVVGALMGPAALGVDAQVPPDSVRADTLAVAGQEAALDSAAQAFDSARAPRPFFNEPRLSGEVPPAWETAVWTWDQSEMRAAGANTLAELLADVPGLLGLFAGDYGTPLALTAFGFAGGGLRVIRDGFEVYPLEGGVPDLARIGLGGIRRVRLDRSGGQLTVELTSLEYDDDRPYSLVEAGTGDLDTNVFRGTFAAPLALGGSVALALERADSRGPRGRQPGNRTGSWLRYQLHRGEGAALTVDFRRMSTATEAPDFAASVTRTDVSLRGRVRLVEGLVGEAFTGRSSHDVDDERAAFETLGGRRTQRGVRLAFERAGLWARGAYRSFGGDDVLSASVDAAAGFSRADVGGVSGSLQRGTWGGRGATARSVRAWTRPVLGVSLFGSWSSGQWGTRTGPLADHLVPDDSMPEEPGEGEEPEEPEEPAPLFGISERTVTRLGASVTYRGATLSAAALRVEADSLFPLGLEPDRGSPPLPGAELDGWEAWVGVPLGFMPGLRVEGSLQKWGATVPYLPEQIYRGAFVYHRTFLESGNLELWWTLGVRGHDPMAVHVLEGEADEPGDPLEVPFYQSWYGRIQVRVVTVRLFVGWENFTVRRNLQNFPGQLLPATRAFYGLRWVMWN